MPNNITYDLPAVSQDLTGRTFERWTVLGFSHRKYYGKDTGHNFWKCRCSCPKKTVRVVNGPSLLSGLSLSCGCLCRERCAKANITHGYTVWGNKHPLIGTHGNIMNRCYNPKCNSYKDYGGRGIRVEESWHNVANFIRDMEPTWNGGFNKYGEKVSVDRISSNSNYGPGLCKWSTALEQANNQRSNVPLTVGEKTMNVSEWARMVDICPATISRRKELGWTDEEAVLTPRGERPASSPYENYGARAKVLLNTTLGDSFIVDSLKEASAYWSAARHIGLRIAKSRIDEDMPQMWVTLLRPTDKPNRVGFRPIPCPWVEPVCPPRSTPSNAQ